MYRLLLILAVVFTFTSCAKKYKIEGTSAITELDGKKVSVKVFKGDSLATVASGTIAHGKFTVNGQIDSTIMADLFVGDNLLFPIVLEQGKISVKINDNELSFGGTPLNEELNKFFKSRDSLQIKVRDIQKLEYDLTVAQVDEQTKNQRLMAEMEKINAEEDRMVTSFIKDHYDNALGIGVFVMLLNNMQYPVMTPQIEDILMSAPEKFKQNSFVKHYQDAAKEFQAQQQAAR